MKPILKQLPKMKIRLAVIEGMYDRLAEIDPQRALKFRAEWNVHLEAILLAFEHTQDYLTDATHAAELLLLAQNEKVTK